MPSAAACPKPVFDPNPPPAPIPRTAAVRRFAALAAAGFRRHSTYRQATIAGVFTNVVFGAMLAAVMSAVVAGGGGRPGGYTGAQLVTYVWVGQGLLSVSYVWTWKELADRVASGDVAADLLRPVDPMTAYAAAELGRAAYAVLGRFIAPVCCGFAFYTMYVPHEAATYPLFAVSVLLATLVGFAGRYLVNLAAFWLLDARGPLTAWGLLAASLSGSHYPLRFLPEWAQWLIWLGTPFPSIFQIPLDIAVERTSTGVAAAMVALQLCWAAALLLVCAAVQRRALRRLVVQGG